LLALRAGVPFSCVSLLRRDVTARCPGRGTIKTLVLIIAPVVMKRQADERDAEADQRRQEQNGQAQFHGIIELVDLYLRLLEVRLRS